MSFVCREPSRDEPPPPVRRPSPSTPSFGVTPQADRPLLPQSPPRPTSSSDLEDNDDEGKGDLRDGTGTEDLGGRTIRE